MLILLDWFCTPPLVDYVRPPYEGGGVQGEHTIGGRTIPTTPRTKGGQGGEGAKAKQGAKAILRVNAFNAAKKPEPRNRL